MKVVNLWGGPGCGKSTTATGLFSLMKMRGHKVELITEYAKDLTYEQDWDMLSKQELMYPEQLKRQTRLSGQVDFAITDSPLPLNIIYARPDLRIDHRFCNTVKDGFHSFDNFNIMLMRVKPYSHYGRKESSDKARDIDHDCVHMLEDMGCKYHWVRGDEDSPVIIYNMLFGNYEISLATS
jgi:ABC-type dipeptide/oligopeptide/nickel transport system ATPase component